MFAPSPVNRRSFLAVTAVCAGAAACAPAAPPVQPQQSQSGGTGWEREWNDLVSAAKQEGKLVINTGLGTGYRKACDAFEAAFGITVDQQGLNASQFTPRVIQERAAGVYTWDIIVTTNGINPFKMREAGVFEPTRPALFRPDVVDDKNWRDGFETGFLDDDKKWGYAGFQTKSRYLWINSEQVKDREIKQVPDLLDPRWKGKILSSDPRSGGGGFFPATVMRLAYGDDIIKRLWKDQEVTLGRENRTMTEQMVRGRFAIGIGAVTDLIYKEFIAQGVGKNMKYLELDNVEQLSGGGNVLFIVNKAPHPNSAKLFANWMLTKEGSEVWGQNGETNSRRIDVPPYDADQLPTPGKKYIQLDTEKLTPELARTQDLAMKVLGA